MSIKSRQLDSQKHPERTEDAQEATAARFRVRAVDAEQTEPPKPFGDLQSHCHVLNIRRRQGCFPDGSPKLSEKAKRAKRKAWQEGRRASFNGKTGCVKLSNGQILNVDTPHANPAMQKLCSPAALAKAA